MGTQKAIDMECSGVIDSLPLPLAQGYRRFRNAVEVRERHDAAHDLFEIYLKYLGSIVTSQYLAGGLRDHRVNAALKGLTRPSTREWLGFLRECLRFLEGSGGLQGALGAIFDLFEGRDTKWKQAVSLFDALRVHRTGKPSEETGFGLNSLLEEAVAYWNRVLDQQAALDPEHYRRFGDLLAGALEEILETSTFLSIRPLLLIDSVHPGEDSRMQCETIELMGLHPDRREIPCSLGEGSAPPREGLLYLLQEDGSLLDLYPFLLAHRGDVYFLSESEGRLEYLSYSTGNRFCPPAMDAKLLDLFERILGFRPNSQTIARIGTEFFPDISLLGEEAAVQEGSRLGSYRILREIGRGGMGTVFEAVQESLRRKVALKVLPGTFALDPRRVERFQREARSAARIHHPNVVPVYEVGETDGTHYYSMELIEGPNLTQVLEKLRLESSEGSRPDGPPIQKSEWIRRTVGEIALLADGLDEAHRMGLVHRDLKPSNILVDPEGRYVLVDFGLVHDEEATTLTRSGELMGTISYMSPEQLARGPVDLRTDVFSLGVTLYEALTLRVPWVRGGEFEIQKAIVFEDPIPPRRLNPSLSRDLEAILFRALEKSPDRRYPSAAALAADLRRCLRGDPLAERPRPAWRRWVRRTVRRRTVWLAAGAAFLILLFAGLWFWGPNGVLPGEIQISDIIVEPGKGTCLLDFRVLNRGGSEVSINRLTLEVLSVVRLPPPLEVMEFSATYDADLSQLAREGDLKRLSVAQRIAPGKVDRFGITVTARAMGDERWWKLKPTLQTSAGEVAGRPVSLWLPVKRDGWSWQVLTTIREIQGEAARGQDGEFQQRRLASRLASALDCLLENAEGLVGKPREFLDEIRTGLSGPAGRVDPAAMEGILDSLKNLEGMEKK